MLSANQRLAELRKQLDTAAPANEPKLLTTARRTALIVSRMLIEAEQPALQNELAKYDAEDAADYLRLERDVRMRQVTLAAAELQTLQTQLSRQRSADSAAALQRARAAVTATPASLRSHAERNVAFAEAADALSEPIETARRQLDATRTRLEGIQKQFRMTEQRVKDVGLTGSIGALLRRQRVELPDLRRLRRNVLERKGLIEDTQYKLFEYDDLRSESIDTGFKRVLQGAARGQMSQQDFESEARSVIEQRREYLDGVIRHYNTYLDTLFDLDSTEQRLIRETERYERYIDERVLWIRSNRTLFTSFNVDASDIWAFHPARWMEVGQQLRSDFQSCPWLYILALIAFSLLLWHKSHFRRELEATSQIAVRGTCTQFAPTVRAGFMTLMLAIAWPGIVFFTAWRLNVSSNGSLFVRSVAQGLFAVSWVYLPLELLRRVCRPRGLADSHFTWSSSTVSVFRSNLKWATLFGLVAVFVTSLLYSSDAEHGLDAIERIAFVMGMVLLAALLRRILRPDSGIFREYLAEHRGGWFDRLKGVWYWGCVLIPLAIAGLTIAGYYYTAQQLTWRFYASVVFVVAVQLVRAFLQRLLLVRRRAICIEQARADEERRTRQIASRPAMRHSLVRIRLFPRRNANPMSPRTPNKRNA